MVEPDVTLAVTPRFPKLRGSVNSVGTAWLCGAMKPCRSSDICGSCHRLATCISRSGSNGCYCNHGYTGDGTTFCAVGFFHVCSFLPLTTDDDECMNVTKICGKGANCRNTDGGYNCTCDTGYNSTGPTHFQTNDGTECIDIDECEKGQQCGPFSNCHNTIGSYYCTCQRDYSPSAGPRDFKPGNSIHCREHPQKDCHDSTGCLTQTVNRTLEYMSNLTEPQSMLGEIAAKTSGDLTSVEVISYVEALFRSAWHLERNDVTAQPNIVNATLTKLVAAVNNLVEKEELVAWSRMAEDLRGNTVTKLLHTVEQSALALARAGDTPAQLDIRASEMELKLMTFHRGQSQEELSVSLGGDHIKIKPKASLKDDSNGSVSLVFVQYDSLGDILKPSSDPGVTDYSRYAGTGEITVNSQVIAVAIKPADDYQLERITFTLRHDEPIDVDADVTKCAFWEYDLGTLQGHWATQGCERLLVNTTATTCSCDHLTHFAILMSSGRANLVVHSNILMRITQLGLIISLICLSMCIFTFWFFSEIQSTRTTIHKNLCCSLFMAEFIFLVGINMNTHKLFCSVIAGLLHYFFLAAFAWMCIEGIHLYLIVVGVIYNKGFLHRNFYIFGYGSPAVVVAISATLGSKYYGTDRVCWLSTENNFIWSFIGPACLIILVNLLAFGVIIFKVFRHTAVKKPEISHYENIRSCACGALALLFVLGATWTFGVLHILHETTLTAYLFTIANTFQGMFIFIFLCVLSRKVQEEYYRLFKNIPCCFECLR
ncbi:Adhesion G protein-coupled receptor L4 [Merluccius polli]|uniref:Adhesion G protein-coupled receptor L4 n=1 Tax=Merluccius polli TaxID=89951 RepID=A0AA47M0T7_MERPO|nr:Adhesion G protein-coupled receptor L4 [Merluccius polli]